MGFFAYGAGEKRVNRANMAGMEAMEKTKLAKMDRLVRGRCRFCVWPDGEADYRRRPPRRAPLETHLRK